MIRILLASHSDFALGLLKTGEMICGKGLMQEVFCISLQPEDGIEELQKQASRYCEQFPQDEFLILVDMLGASPFNVCASVFQDCEYRIVTGMNLPMLIETAIHKDRATLIELSEYAQRAGREGIEVVQFSTGKNKGNNEDEEDFL